MDFFRANGYLSTGSSISNRGKRRIAAQVLPGGAEIRNTAWAAGLARWLAKAG
jgi:hypothetical protein